MLGPPRPLGLRGRGGDPLRSAPTPPSLALPPGARPTSARRPLRERPSPVHPHLRADPPRRASPLPGRAISATSRAPHPVPGNPSPAGPAALRRRAFPDAPRSPGSSTQLCKRWVRTAPGAVCQLAAKINSSKPLPSLGATFTVTARSGRVRKWLFEPAQSNLPDPARRAGLCNPDWSWAQLHSRRWREARVGGGVQTPRRSNHLQLGETTRPTRRPTYSLQRVPEPTTLLLRIYVGVNRQQITPQHL